MVSYTSRPCMVCCSIQTGKLFFVFSPLPSCSTTFVAVSFLHGTDILGSLQHVTSEGEALVQEATEGTASVQHAEDAERKQVANSIIAKGTAFVWHADDAARKQVQYSLLLIQKLLYNNDLLLGYLLNFHSFCYLSVCMLVFSVCKFHVLIRRYLLYVLKRKRLFSNEIPICVYLRILEGVRGSTQLCDIQVLVRKLIKLHHQHKKYIINHF